LGHAHVVVEVQGVAEHPPATEPRQEYEESAQSDEVPHGSWHVPPPFATAPMHVCVKPQSALVWHAFVVPTSADADTWKSLNTTRPHWFAEDDPYGALNVKCGSKFADTPCAGWLFVAVIHA
jgi:hypothetical protein